MTELLTVENAIALLTLTALEIVLGIDNIVFISILAAKLDEDRRALARRIGLGLAMISRLLLLFAINWVMLLKEPLFSILGEGISGRDLILLFGGLFLIGKATFEIHDKLEEAKIERQPSGAKSFMSVLIQITLLDMVFSLDSVITAVGMAESVAVMATAIIIAVAVMLIFAGSIGEFIERHPTFKILALSFLLLIGVMLVAEGSGRHVEKGYIYFAMGFSLFVESINIRIRRHPPAETSSENAA